MQTPENSVLGLRAARHRLTSPRSAVSVTLYPMVHVGDLDFFHKVYTEAFCHDIVLVEGVCSPVVRHLTASYRWIERSRLGLVVQPPYPTAASVSARIVHADLSEEEFQAEWCKVPAYLRLAAFAFSPMVGFQRRFFASRESLAGRMTMEDKLSAEEILSWDPDLAALQHCILGARDARVVEHLCSQLDQASPQKVRLAIVYGAAHMRAILGELRRRDFRSVESVWQTVFSS